MIKNSLHNRNNGFTLLEALLTTAIITGIFVVIFEITHNYSERVLMRSTSNYMEKVAGSIENILQYPEFYELIYAEADAQPNNIISSITPNDIINGNIGTLTLPVTSRLNSSFLNSTPLKTGVSIMIRATPGDAIEIIVATNELASNKRVRTAAEFSKLHGGFYSEAGGNIKHAYNAWNFPIATFAGTPWYTTVTTAPTGIPSPANGAYLVNYRHISFDEIAGDYLYRTRFNGRQELNTLYSDLDMGGQNILGADNVDIAGSANLQSKAVVNGAVSVVSDANFIGGNLRTSGTMVTNSANINSTLGGSTGNFVVQDRLQTNNLNIESVNASSAAFRNGLQTSGNLTSPMINNVETIISNDINATNFNTGGSGNVNIDLANGTMNAQAIVTPSLTINGANPIGFNDAVLNNLEASEVNAPLFSVNNLDVNTFGACEDGC